MVERSWWCATAARVYWTVDGGNNYVAAAMCVLVMDKISTALLLFVYYEA